jgi:radical SAM superfamily enzyme YgiQ (UPF0313 family)
MRVALIRPRVINAPDPPLGLLSIAPLLLQEGLEVRIWDPEPREKGWFEELVRWRPELIGLSLLTTQYGRAREIGEEARRRLPGVRLVAGGIHPTALPERTLRELQLDFVVRGEGERALPALCRALAEGRDPLEVPGVWQRQGETVLRGAPPVTIEDLDEIPYPARELVEFERYLRPPGNIRGILRRRATSIYTSRGCPFACTFCSSHEIFGRRIRCRSVDHVMAEVHELVGRYRIDGLWFLDDTLLERPEWTSALCREFRRAGFRFAWGCQGHVRRVTRELLQEMKASGCVQLEFGVESGSPRILRTMRKGASPEDVVTAFRICRQVGIRTLANFMIGNEGETAEDVELSFALARRIRPDHVVVTFTTPMPGSELYRRALARGALTAHTPFGEEWTIRQTEQPFVALSLDPEEMIRLRARFDNHFFITNHIGYLRDPRFLADVLWRMLRNPRPYARGLVQACRARRLGHLIETIWDEYNRI